MAPTSFSGTSKSNSTGTYRQPNQSPSEASGTLKARTVRPLDPTERSPVHLLADSRLKYSELKDRRPISPLDAPLDAIGRPDYLNHLELKDRQLTSLPSDHFAPLIDEVIRSCELVSDNPEDSESSDFFYQSVKKFHQALLEAPDSCKHIILNKLIQDIDTSAQNKFGKFPSFYKHASLIHRQMILNDLLINCRIIHTKNEQALFDAIKRLNILDEIDIRRHEGYLTESRTQVFQRKIAARNPLIGPPEELLLPRAFPEIKSVSRIQREELLEYRVGPHRRQLKVAISENGYPVLQQQNVESCGQTCLAMVLMDLGFQPDFSKLEGGLTNYDQRMEVIKGLALREIRNHLNTKNEQEFLEELREKIHKNGSALIGIDGGSGFVGHGIVCDDISADLQTVRIRDPWHGWEVSLNAKSFLDAVFPLSTRQSGGPPTYCTTIQQLQRT